MEWGGESPPVLTESSSCFAPLCKLQRGFFFPFEGESSTSSLVDEFFFFFLRTQCD